MALRRRNTAVMMVAAIALLLHALLPFYASYQVPTANDAKHMSSLFGDKVLICTAEGFVFVSWEDLLSGKEHPKPHKQYQCALCYVAAHGQGMTPHYSDYVAVPLLVKHYAVLFSIDKEPLASESLWRKLRTRSPPLSFVA